MTFAQQVSQILKARLPGFKWDSLWADHAEALYCNKTFNLYADRLEVDFGTLHDTYTSESMESFERNVECLSFLFWHKILGRRGNLLETT